ncbi:MAG: hypothetical protein LBP59_05725 [Planctomycetaceae bacterium]|nr:hypothetical protein [Planctomycetaceae bacterium]
MSSLAGQVGQIFIVTINLSHILLVLEIQRLYRSYLNFSDLKASKPAVRKLGRRR